MAGIFGNMAPQAGAVQAYQPQRMSLSDMLGLAGAAAKQIGNGGDDINQFQQELAGRQMMQQRLAAQQSLMGLMGPGSGGQGGPGGGPVDINAALPRLAAAQAMGINTTPFLEMLKAAQPNMQVANGVTYDPHKIGAGERVGVNLQNVNGVQMDLNDPSNKGRFVPQLDKGQEPLYDGQGRVIAVRNIDGSVKSAADMAGAVAEAQAGAQANYDLVDVPNSDGSSQKLPRAQALSMLGGGPGRGPGLPGGGMPGQGAPGGGFGRSQSPSDAAYAGEQAKASSALYSGLQDAASKAPGRIAQYQQLGTLLDGYNGNKLSKTGIELARLGASMGLPVDPKLGNREAASAIANQMALQLRDPSSGGGMPGAMSNSDRDYLANMVPNLSQSDAGRKQLVEMYVAKTKRDQDVGHLASQWQQRYGRIDRPDGNGKTFQDQMQTWAEKHPLFGKH